MHNISITCFAASYLVVLVLELTRVFFKAKLRSILRISFTVAGLFAHTAYLVYQGQLEIGDRGIWLSHWMAWFFTASWLMALAYLWISVRKPESLVGLFLLPMVLVLILAGIGLADQPAFTVRQAKTGWNMVHGLSLLLATASVALGFVFGLIYLLQARRLKQKVVATRFRLPSLEWLQRCSERSLIVSTLLMGLGLVSGIAINLVQQSSAQGPAAGTVAWSNPVVWSTAILLVWLLSISIISVSYQPARQGRKVAYLVVSSFLFLVFELAIVWLAGHASATPPASPVVPDPVAATVLDLEPDSESSGRAQR